MMSRNSAICSVTVTFRSPLVEGARPVFRLRPDQRKYQKLLKTATAACAICGILLLATSTANASPNYYAQLNAHVRKAGTDLNVFIKCPELVGGRIAGKACAARTAKAMGTQFSFVLSLAAGVATEGKCVGQLKTLQKIAGNEMTVVLTFAVAQPSATAANVNARTGVIQAMTTVVRADDAVVRCMRA